MSTTLFNRMMKLCQTWPKDPTKPTRDFGEHLEKQLKVWFPKGQLTKLNDSEEIDRQICALERLNSDVHRRKYTDPKVSKLYPASLLSKEEIKKAMSTEFLKDNEEMQNITGRIKSSIREHQYSDSKLSNTKKLID